MPGSPPVTELVIERRFCGPPQVANGGYLAGRLAEIVGEPAEVTLRSPAPLERPLRLERLPDGGARLYDGETLVAEARRHEPHATVPAAPSFADATRAGLGFAKLQDNQFAGCFVCGTARPAGDGLGIHPGALRRPPTVVAAPWVPDGSLAGEGDIVLPRYMWAALDCIGAYALHNQGYAAGHLVLGRIAARVTGTVGVGEHCVVMGWPLEPDGKKQFASTALLDGRGWVAAVTVQTWLPAAGRVPDA